VAFNPSRLVIARKRRGLSRIGLARASGLSVRSIAYYEMAEINPSEEAVRTVAAILRFPEVFFYRDDLEEPSCEASSFRALTTMTAAQRDAALAAGAVAIEFSKWIEQRFKLPTPDLPNLRGFSDPETAAAALRAAWKLGERPIKNVIHLLEAHGVRLFSLPVDTTNIDAFSVWHRDTPFIFLNQDKSAERIRMDCGHELGHLTMHRQHGGPRSRPAELEADRFGAAFLMPPGDILARARRRITLEETHQMKIRWGVSAIALIHRLKSLNLLTEWQYRSLCIEVSQEGGRKTERNGVSRDNSQVLNKVFEMLRADGWTRAAIAKDLAIDSTELEAFLRGLTLAAVEGGRIGDAPTDRQKPNLKAV
jgi:Zn-dependent peptidase ImmA (M78 family)